MKLDTYIGDLLFEHDCVIVSEFGGFVANYKNATIHPVQHSFSPPAKQIAFNESLKNNDGLLANYISNRLSISYPEACNLINDFVTACNQRLSANNKLVIENIGELFYDYENNLQFTPDEKVNYLLDSFGLFEIQSPAIKREKGYEIFEGDEKLAAKILPAAKRKKIIKPLLRTIGVLGVAALLTIAYFNPTINGTISKGIAGINVFESPNTEQQIKIPNQDIVQKPEVTIQETPQPFEEKNTVAAVTENKPEDVSATEITKEENKAEIKKDVAPVEANTSVTLPKVEPAPAKKEPVVNETTEKAPLSVAAIKSNGGNFFIIGGCFGVHENAVAFTEELKTKGFPSQLLGKGKKGLEMVCISSAASRDKAEEMLGFIHDSGYPDAWIMKK